MATFSAEIEISPSEYLAELSKKEENELFEELRCEVEKLKESDIVEYLRGRSDFELKRILANALYVPSYYDDDALKTALRPIINAR